MPNPPASAVKNNASILSFFSKTSGHKSENSESEDVMDLDSNEDAKQSTVQIDASSDPSGMSDDEDLVPVVKRDKSASSKTRPAITNRLPQKNKDTPHNSNLPPISEISLMFKDLVNRCPAIIEFAKKLRGRPLRVATMCSGTEAPLLALGLISRALGEEHDTVLKVEHVFSCEIEPFKQAYIERNFRPPILFRDVCELGSDEATTAYGALVPVPGNVDMLVAGTSCVDYSTLNNEKKDIDANGESGRTFRGMLSWVQKHRPKVVILENVCSAPWDRVVEKFGSIMYSAAHQRLDTKNYYIPHTRTRGYLVAINQRNSSLPDKWKRRIAELVRPASSTLDAFLLESDDPRIHHARQALVSETINHERKAGYDWGRCESRHIKARHDEQLGNRRPLTNWEEGASCKMPDFAWNDWGAVQVDRVWDLMDITTLRSAKLYEDPAYKTKIWNLSQNVDRQIGSSRVGIAPCFTPTMIPYLTNRGGPLVGAEALGLQGIPVDELNFTRETQDQLADLAGNAMSSTVVGSAMVAALELVTKMFADESSDDAHSMEVDASPADTSSQGEKAVSGVEQLHTGTIDLSAAAEQSLSTFLSQARASARLCYCEGRDGVLERTTKQCVDCGSTVCEKCAGRPEHNHKDMDFSKSPRVRPSEYRSLLKEHLPMSVMLHGFSTQLLDDCIDKLGQVTLADAKWKNAVLAAAKEPLHFKTDKRQENWVVLYESTRGVLELHLNPLRPEWLFFARPEKNEAAKSKLRSLLSYPVARLVCKDALLEGVWDIAVPTNESFSVTVEGVGELVPSWEMRLGLEGNDFREKKVWSSFRISHSQEFASMLDRQIAGEYIFHDKCGTACSALHKKVEDNPSAPPLFLFLDPDRCGDASDDAFVFSSSIRRVEYGESRTVFASLDPSWRPSSKSGSAQVTCRLPCRWLASSEINLKPTAGLVAKFGSPTVPLAITAAPDACASAAAVLISSVPLTTSSIDAIWPRDSWYTVDSVNERATFQKISWLLQRIQNFHSLEDWATVPFEHYANCVRCSPRPPDLLWTQSKKGIVAVEDPLQAGHYEHALKHRPTSFVTQLKLDTTSSTATVRLGVNVTSLLHRALSLLPHKPQSETPRLSWRLTTGYVSPVRLEPPKFILGSNRSDQEHEQPPNFRIPLRPEQLRSLTWMMHQESKGASSFMEEEVVEAILAPLGWRVEAKVQRPIRVSGGVLADEVGYGKTAITLGLIDASPHADPGVTPERTSAGKIRAKATIVAVPAHLTRQWKAEIKKFLGGKYKAIVLETMTSLNQYTVEDILDADIILVASSLQKSEQYLARLAAFSTVGSFPTKDGRYFDAKLKQAHEGVQRQITILDAEGPSAMFSAIKNAEDNPKSDLFLPSRRKGKHDQPDMRSVDNTKPRAPRPTPNVLAEVVITSRPPTTVVRSSIPTPIVISSDDEGASRASSSFEVSGAETESEEDEPPTTKQKQHKVSAPKKVAQQGKIQSKKRKNTDSDTESVDMSTKGKKRKTGPAKTPKTEHEREKIYRKDPWNLGSPGVRRDWTQMKCPPLEMFHFERLVIDEYTYLEGKVYSLVTKLHSDHRWILSGTPPTEDFTSVKTIAAFLGVHLGVRDDFWEGQSKESLMSAKRRQREQTSVEHFHSFREVHSLHWHAHRDEVAQEFLNRFVRQNIAEIDEIPFSDIIKPITLPAAERAIYLELEHHLRALDMTVRKGKKTESDRERRMQESLGNSNSAEEALLKRCSHFELEVHGENALRACELIVEERTKQLHQCLEELKKQFAKAIADEKKIGPVDPHSHFREWCRMAHSDRGVGDSDAKTALHEIQAEAGYAQRADDRKKPSLDPDSEDKKTKDARWAHREHAHVLKKLEKELVGRYRSLRYFTVVRDLQQESERTRTVSCPVCGKANLPISDTAILSSCGHMGCHSCVLAKAQEEECVCRQRDGCTAVARILNIVKADTLGVDEDRDMRVKHFGMKLEKVVALVKKCINQEDKVLLFVQFPDLMAKVAEALTSHKIKYLEIRGSNSQKSGALAKFQDDGATEKVLLLNVGDESASGANLTNANHVIFLSPLLTPSQQFYTATDIQAIGRVRRYGQQKKAFIHRFLTLNSIDAEIFEARDPAKRKVPT